MLGDLKFIQYEVVGLFLCQSNWAIFEERMEK